MRGSCLLAVGLLTLAIPAPVRALDPSTPLSQYTLTSWDERNGLTATVIRSIVQDTRGYLWLGTNGGLLRFDGVRFVRIEVQRAPNLPFSEVGALAAGQDGSIWAGFLGAGGVSRVHDGTVTNFGTQHGLPDAAVTELLEDATGTVWAGTRFGLSRLRNGRWEMLDASHGLAPEAVLGLHQDAQGGLWVATASAGFHRPPTRDMFERVSSPRVPRAFASDTTGALWISSAGDGNTVELFRTAAASGPSMLATRVAGVPRVAGAEMLHDRDGNIWLGRQGGGLIRLSTAGGRPHVGAIEQLTEAEGLTSNSILALYEDREGNLWIGTQAGLTRLSDVLIRRVPARGELQSGEPVRAVTATRDGAILIGGQDGLYKFAGAVRQKFDGQQGLPDGVVSALHINGDGGLWVATSGGLARWANGRFHAVPIRGIEFNVIRALTTDRTGSVWVSDISHGISRVTPDGRGGYTLTFTRPNIGMAILTDRQGRTWVGFADGNVGMYDAGKFRVFTHADGLVGDRAAAIHEDGSGRIWIGTNGGLSRFDTGRFMTVRTGSGFPLERVTAITEDDTGYLWLGVGNGLIRVSPDEFDKTARDPSHRIGFTLFDMSDGLAGAPSWIGYPTATRGSDGQLWFTTSHGLAVVDPRRTVTDAPAPPLLVEDVLVDGQPLEAVRGLAMPPGTSRLQINYTSLSFASAAKIRFRYRLEGFDKDWIDAGMRRQAFYTNLAPGAYTFRIMADAPGASLASSSAWEFSVKPAFYQSYWFYALVTVVVSGTVLGGWRLRTRKMHAQFAAVLTERTRMGREIHDTLLQGLVGVALQLDDLSHRVETSPATAPSFVNKIREQVEGYIRETRRSIWVLRSPSLETDALPEALRKLGTNLAVPARFEFVATGNPRTLDPNTAEQLLRIAQEATANAVRHGHPTSIRVELTYQDRATVLRVIDDGRGFDSDTADQIASGHWGLLGMRERAQQAGGRCRILSRPGHGTEVEVVLPPGSASPAHA